MRERDIRVATYIEDWSIAASSQLETTVHTKTLKDTMFQNKWEKLHRSAVSQALHSQSVCDMCCRLSDSGSNTHQEIGLNKCVPDRLGRDL